MGPAIPRALIVDDDPDLLDLARTYLGDKGDLEILIADSGSQALERLDEQRVDVVISDYQMPGMDGIELLKLVRERHGDLPFILFTGRGREDVVIQALNEGADFYLQKGGDLKVQFAELEHKIWRAIRSHRSNLELRESRAFIKTLLDNLPLGIAVNSVEPRVQFEYINENFLRFYRISRESLATPDSFWDAVYEDPEFREKIRDRVLEDCASGDRDRMRWEDVPITREGEETTFIGAMNIPFNDNKFMMSVVWDVTERKRAEDRLRSLAEEYEKVFQGTQDALFLVEAVGGGFRYIRNNRAHESATGIPLEVIRDKTPQELLGEELGGRVASNCGRCVRSASPISYEEELDLPIGRRIWHTTLTPIFHEGEPAYIIGSGHDITDRKKAELALKRMNQLLSRSQEMAQIGSWEFDWAPRSLTLSGELYSIFGSCPEGPLDSYETLLQSVHPDDRPSADEVIKKSVHEGAEGFETYHRIIRRDNGEVRFIHVRCNHERDASGNLVRSVGMMQDITDRRRVQEALQRSEERYRTIFENINSAMAIIEGDMTFSLVNDEFAGLTGYTKEEIEGKMVSMDVVAPEDRERLEGYHRQRRRDPGSSPRKYEFRMLTKGGEIRECQVVISIVPGTDQSIVSLIDLSELKRMQRELVAKNLEQARILDNIDVQVWYATDPETYGMVNKARADFLGLTKEEMIGRRICDLVRKSDELKVCMESNWRAFRGEKVVQEESITTTNGEIKCVLVSKIPVFDEGGGVEYVVCTATDIDRLKALEGALRLANEKISILFGVTRHDVLNQLAVITGYLGLLKNPSRRDSLDQYIERMEDAASRIISHLEFTKEVETMGSEPPRWMRLSEPIGRALSGLDLEGISVHVDESVDSIHLFCDTLTWKVFYNLLHNTLEHADGATSVSIRAEETEGGLRIVYEDDGPGIPGRMRKRLFNFGVGKRSGRGLYLVKRILSLYDMDIKENGERGARFVIHVPPYRYRIG